MKDNYLTVKEFAEAAGVSVQRIYQRLDTNLKPFIKTLNGKKMLSVEGLELFEIKDLNEKQSSLDGNGIKDLENIKGRYEAITMEYTLLDERFKAIVKELENSEKIIAELKADKNKLNDRLDKAEADRTELIASNKELTIALKAAQALHGMDKQQAAIEVKAEPNTVSPIPSETQQTTEQEKKSLFANIFRRRK